MQRVCNALLGQFQKCAMIKLLMQLYKMVAEDGFEPPTHGL
jgi:hypothetical protein